MKPESGRFVSDSRSPTESDPSLRAGPRPPAFLDSILEGDVDLVAAELDPVGRDGLECGQAKRLAGPDVEPRPVTRALDLGAVELTLGQRTAVVGAESSMA